MPFHSRNSVSTISIDFIKSWPVDRRSRKCLKNCKSNESLFPLHLLWRFPSFLCFFPIFRFGSKSYITVEQFVEFLNSYQRDPRLNEILYPYANPDRARDLFQQYEPSEHHGPKGHHKLFPLCYFKDINTLRFRMCRKRLTAQRYGTSKSNDSFKFRQP